MRDIMGRCSFGIIEQMKKTYYELSSILQPDKLNVTASKAFRKTNYTVHSQVSKPSNRKLIFQLPQNLDRSIDLLEMSELQKDIISCVKTSLDDIEELRRSYSNICQERKKYKDIVDWLKQTLTAFLSSFAANNSSKEKSLEELHNIYSSAIFEMIKQLKTQNSEKACLIKISWESVTSFHNSLAKDFEKQMQFQKDEINKKHCNQRQLYDQQIVEYQQRLEKSELELAKRERHFYEVVKDNRILRKRLNKLTDKVQFQQECNSYLKEQNIMFYKQNEKLKLMLESQMIEQRYRELLVKLEQIEKQFEEGKKRTTKAALTKELKTTDFKHRVGIERQINEIIKRVNTIDFLDLEMTAFPPNEQKTKLYHSLSSQTEPSVESVGINTFLNVSRRAVSTQFNFAKFRKRVIGREIQITIEPEIAHNLDNVTPLNLKNKGKQTPKDLNNRRGSIFPGQFIEDRLMKKAKKALKESNAANAANKNSGRPSGLIDSKQGLGKQYKRNSDSRDRKGQRKSLIPNNGLPQIRKDKLPGAIHGRRSTFVQPTFNLSKLMSQSFRSSLKNNNQIDKAASGFSGQKPSTSLGQYKIDDDPLRFLQKGSKESMGLVSFAQMQNNYQIKMGTHSSDSESSDRSSDSKDQLQFGASQGYSMFVPLPRRQKTEEIYVMKPELSTKKTKKDVVKRNQQVYSTQKGSGNDFRRELTVTSEMNTSSTALMQSRLLHTQLNEQSTQLKMENCLGKQSQQANQLKQTKHRRQSRQLMSTKWAKQNKQIKQTKYSMQVTKFSHRQSLKTLPSPSEKSSTKLNLTKNQRTINNKSTFTQSSLHVEQSIKQISKIDERDSESGKSQKSIRKRQYRMSLHAETQLLKTSPAKLLDRSELNMQRLKTKSLDRLPESYMFKIFKKINAQILNHKNSLLKHQASFQEFIEMNISHNYGLKILTTQMTQKLKTSLLRYSGSDTSMLVFRKLISGQESNPSSTYYKKHIFRIYILILQFWANYSQLQNFEALQVDFIRELFSTFFNQTQTQKIINFLQMIQINSEYKLFTVVENVIETESQSLAFMNTIYNLQSVLSCRHAISFNQLVQLLSIIQSNKLQLHSKVRTLFKYSDNKTKNLPFFNLVLQLNKLNYTHLLNLQPTIEAVYKLIFPSKQGQRQKLQLQLNRLKSYIPESRYLKTLESMDTDNVRQSQVILYQLVKLEFSNHIIRDCVQEVMGEQLSTSGDLITEALLKLPSISEVKT